jgi:ATP-dependent Lhr-like helicase
MAIDVLTASSDRSKCLVRAENNKTTEIITILPDEIEKFPWAGHIGLRLLPEVVAAVSNAKTTLVFTNTRSQAELWFQSIVKTKPKWEDKIALHHGSLDREIREAVEDGLRTGVIRCVVCTSSLDLGVDFPAVDQVIQIGSPKGVARLLQRAGRSGHQPGGVSRILCIPTNAFELVEYSATRDAANDGQIELRIPPDRPIDALTQHVVTLAAGEGFDEEELFKEIKSTWSYRQLTREEWDWVLEFEARGGPALRAYDQYRKIHRYQDRWHITSDRLAKLHRLNIGTITGDMNITLQLQGGGILGTVEENFIAKLRPKDSFVFAGRILELVRLKELNATVRFAEKQNGMLPTWGGSRMPITSQLGRAVREKLNDARQGNFDGPEMQKVKPILDIQSHWSIIPAAGELLIETIRSREGYHVFLFPFEGHFVHEGLGALIGWRISRLHPRTIGVTMNDYGFELLSHEPIDLQMDEYAWRQILSRENLVEDLVHSVNATELAKRQFREVARVAGLIFAGYPGAPKVARQIQSSTSLLFDVFNRYDPENLLIDQARREVMERQMEVVRLAETLERISKSTIRLVHTTRFTPLAFPLWASRMSSSTAHLSSESYSDRIRRMVAQLEDMAEQEMAADE